MDDLIERLRAGAGRWPIALLDEAADRIEALQREWDEIRAAFEDSQTACRAAIEAGNDLVRERDALREAISTHRRNVWGDGSVGHEEDLDLYAALGGKHAD